MSHVTSSAARHRGRGSRTHGALTLMLASSIVLGLVGSLAAVFFYRHLNENLVVKDIEAQLGDDRPEQVAPGKPVNILVMGSDTREGKGNNIDGLTETAEHSDTTILVHLSSDRTFAYGVSIPRDSVVDRPDCTTEDGEEIPPAPDSMFNTAFTAGGPGCTVRTVEQLTGIKIDHYVKVDGFRDMVDAVDGVTVCIPEAVEDPAHNIFLPEGVQNVRGKEALAYVRSRYAVGNGSDIGRIKRQQAFVASLVNKVVSAGTLARVDRLVSFLDAATKTVQVDSGLGNVAKLAALGNEFRDIGLDEIKFVTIPWEVYPDDPNRVQWAPEAAGVWERIRKDNPLSAKQTEGAISANAPPGVPTAEPTQEPTDGPVTDDPSGLPSEDTGSPGSQPSRRPEGTLDPDEAAAVGLCA